jgi:DNA adenine methylase
MADYSKNTREELIALCKERSIKGYSTKKKTELIELLSSSSATTISPPHTQVVKPFLKWVGGKTQILEDVLSAFPATIANYHEPFLGGGAVLLGLLSSIKAGKIILTGGVYASDINANIINIYKHIQSNPNALVAEVKVLVDEYASITGTTVNRKPDTKEAALTSQESYYYWIRSKFNATADKSTPQAAAMLVFMNKTCFRGVYREGPNGFNVPFGNYNNPQIIDPAHIMQVSELIKDVVFTAQPFQDALKKVINGDFVYMDPPYAPETTTSFVGYTADGFDLDAHNTLFEMSRTMTTNGTNWVMSNASVSLVRDAFTDAAYTTKTVSARRAINSKNPEAKTDEVLISSNTQ